ncbi:MAG: hypothetical protein HW388_26 [Dehalococcoidia bacterium]|nr:hypothetical protein [Dehalococcoidia bacterium]
MRDKEIRDAVSKARRPPSPGVDLSPASTFDALLDQRIRELERHVGELKARVNGLLFLVVGAVIAQIVLGLLRQG